MVQALKKQKWNLAWVLLGVLTALFLEWNIVQTAILAVFIWALVGPIASRYLILPALFFLALLPILLAMGREDQAEEFAIYTYYFLVMTVVRGIIELQSPSAEEKSTFK